MGLQLNSEQTAALDTGIGKRTAKLSTLRRAMKFMGDCYHVERQVFSLLSRGSSTFFIFLVGNLTVLPAALICRLLALRSAFQNAGKMEEQASQLVSKGLL